MSANFPLECTECGLALGLGIPGSLNMCSRCEKYVVAKARQGDAGAAIGGLVLIGAGLVIGALVVALIKSIFD